MTLHIPQGVLYLPMLALWITLVGALLNREGPVVVVPVATGVLAAVPMALLDVPWLLVPVVLLWLLGLLIMLRRHRTDAK